MDFKESERRGWRSSSCCIIVIDRGENSSVKMDGRKQTNDAGHYLITLHIVAQLKVARSTRFTKEKICREEARRKDQREQRRRRRAENRIAFGNVIMQQ